MITRLVNSIVVFVINLILWLLICVFILPPSFLLFIYKSMVILIAQRKDNHLHPTTPNDVYFAIGDTNTIPIANVAQIWRIDGIIPLTQFKNHFQELFLSCSESRINYLNFYCYLKQFGGYVFKRSVHNLDIDKHIIVRTLGETENLQEFIVKWVLEEKWHENRPLWEIVLIYFPRSPQLINLDNDKNEGETVVLLKMHHCLTDGYGFIHIVSKLTGIEAPYIVKQEQGSFCQKMKTIFNGPRVLLMGAIKMSLTPNLFYPLKRPGNGHWFISFNTIDLCKLKALRRSTNTHFSNLVMSLIIGALRRYLVKTRDKSVTIPDNIWVAHSLPWPNHPRTTLVNHWTGGMFQVPFKTGDALERLYGAEKYYQKFHDDQVHKLMQWLVIPFSWCVPSSLLRWVLSLDLFSGRYSNFVACLMLSEKPHYLLGRRVKHLYMPTVIKDSAPTCVHFGVSTSHSGQIDLSLLASNELVPDQAALDQIANVYLVQELEQLCHSVKDRMQYDVQSETCEHISCSRATLRNGSNLHTRVDN